MDLKQVHRSDPSRRLPPAAPAFCSESWLELVGQTDSQKPWKGSKKKQICEVTKVSSHSVGGGSFDHLYSYQIIVLSAFNIL